MFYLWLLKLQVLPELDGEVDVLQDDVDSFLVRAVKRQEPHHAVVIDLNPRQRHVTKQQKPLIQNCGVHLPDHRWPQSAS